LRANVDESDPDERNRYVRHVLDNLDIVLGHYSEILDRLDQLEDPSLSPEECEALHRDIEERRGIIYQHLLKIDLNFTIIEQIATRIKSVAQYIENANNDIRDVIVRTMLSEEDLRRIVKKTRRNSPEAKALEKQYGLTIDQFIKMD